MHYGPRILVVDDDEPVRSAIAALLHGYAGDIQQAGSVAGALYCLSERDFDLVICDLYMPEAHGLELVKKLREQQRDLAVVVISGRAELPDVITALQLRAAGFLQKPFTRAQLLDALAPAYEALQQRRMLAKRVTMLSSEVEEKSKELREALVNLKISERSSLEALVIALDAREHETYAHSFRVRAYTSCLAEQVRYPLDLLAELECAALLHDVGKIVVPDSILLKPGRLTEEEFERCKTHAVTGARILGSIPSLRGVASIVMHHHERWDGNGYPDRLAGTNIPLGARLFAIADTLDALLSDRCYRPATSFTSAKNEIVRCSGTQFDPGAVAAFLSIPEEQWLKLRSAAHEEFSQTGWLPPKDGSDTPISELHGLNSMR